jgi:4-diphosphocytidyl-2-C-methyl-D-erythritol kinase
MSGTGSAVFASFANRATAAAALKGLPEGWRGYVCRGLNRSPLMDRLDVH